MFRICDILRGIRIPGFVHWITDPALFVSGFKGCQQKASFYLLLFYFIIFNCDNKELLDLVFKEYSVHSLEEINNKNKKHRNSRQRYQNGKRIRIRCYSVLRNSIVIEPSGQYSSA